MTLKTAAVNPCPLGVLQRSVNWVLDQARQRLGNSYVYGGVYSPNDTSQGADCSAVVGWVLEALTKTPARMSWWHNVSTESWPYDYNNDCPAKPGTVGPYGTIAVASPDDIPDDAALIINIEHGGGGEDSHTNCCLAGVLIESNGSYGSCTNGSGAYPTESSLWTDHWYLPGPINNDVPVAPGKSGTTYVVEPGDTLEVIAERFGVGLDALESANPDIANPNMITVGEVITIP